MTPTNDYQPDLSLSVDENSDVVKNVTALLAAGELKLGDKFAAENATLILGGSGAGKSTLVLRLAGYDSQLLSKKKFLDYVITSTDNGTISNGYTISKTIFPELMLNNRTKAAYYDFPGFEDTRGAVHDIATTYFIKKVVDNVKRIKLVFLINYNALTIGGNRYDFTSLVDHITKFVKNIDRFKDSIALIATKVSLPANSDSEIIDSMVEFIQEAKSSLEETGGKSRDVQLMNIFLTKMGNRYPKMGISRSPNKIGYMNKIPLIQSNTKNIEAILEKLVFTEKLPSDFGYFIPKQSLNEVGKMITAINKSLISSIEKTGKEIQEYLSTKENHSNNMSKLNDEMNQVHEELIEMKKKANQHEQAVNCVQQLINGTATMKNDIIEQHLLHAMRYGNYTEFLHSVSDHETSSYFKCGEGLNYAIDYSDKAKTWYQFLSQLYAKLSEYQVQKNAVNNSCINLANKVDEIMKNPKNASVSMLEPFIIECDAKYGKEFNENMALNAPKLNFLRKILNSTIKPNLHQSCDSNKLIVKGSFIVLSDVEKYWSNCTSRPKVIEIFASHKVFIDDNIDKTGENVQISIISPTWDIQGHPKIILDGVAGNASHSIKAENAKSFGESGKVGEPGFPGGPGGHFFGIGETFFNLENLLISVNGGRGGPGQHGGDGIGGQNGTDAYYDIYFENASKEGYKRDLDENGWFKVKSANHKFKHIHEQHDPLDSSIYALKYTLAGKEGGSGGNGGDGGKGGIGGPAGELTFISLSPSTNKITPKMQRAAGENGVDGKGGQGGPGGVFGKDLIITIKSGCFSDVREVHLDDTNQQATSGKNGTDGGNILQLQPIMKTNDLVLNPSHLVNQYNDFVKENIDVNVEQSKLEIFLKNMETNIHLQNHHRKRRHINYSSDVRDTDANQILPIHSKNTDSSNYPSPDKATHLSEKSSENFVSSIKSAIRNFFPAWNYFKPDHSIMNRNFDGYHSIKTSYGEQSQSSIQTPAENYVNQATQVAKFDVIESLALADFVIRCFTKIKPYNSGVRLIKSSEVKASALSIIATFENILKDVCENLNISVESLSFDPIVLMSKLEKEVMNSNFKQVGEILYQSIENNSRLDDVEIHNHIQATINEMLNGRTEKKLCS